MSTPHHHLDMSDEERKKALKELYATKLEAENELATALSYLQGVQAEHGIDGLRGSLIDREGFPIPDVDHYAIRRARNTVDCRRRDLTAYSEELLALMQTKKEDDDDADADTQTQQRTKTAGEEKNDAADNKSHGSDSSVKDENMAYYKRIVEQQKKKEAEGAPATHQQQQNKHEMNTAETKKTMATTTTTLTAPLINSKTSTEKTEATEDSVLSASNVYMSLFRVDSVQENSPAAEADLQDGDFITRFGTIGPFFSSSSASSSSATPEQQQQEESLGDRKGEGEAVPGKKALMTAVAQEVKAEEGCGITVDVLRHKKEKKGKEANEVEKVELVLVPERWSGAGLLGCILTALVPE